MVDQGADFLRIEWFVDKTIDAEVDGFFKKGVPTRGNREEDPRVGHPFDIQEQVFLTNPGRVEIQDKDMIGLGGEGGPDLINIVKRNDLMTVFFKAFTDKPTACRIMIDNANLSGHTYPFHDGLWIHKPHERSVNASDRGGSQG